MGDDGKFYMKRWNDSLGPSIAGLGVASLTQEAYRDTPAQMVFWNRNQDDSETFYHQLTHGVHRSTQPDRSQSTAIRNLDTEVVCVR